MTVVPAASDADEDPAAKDPATTDSATNDPAATDPAAKDPTAILDTIVVIAHRQARRQSEVAGTVTVFGTDRLERDLAIDIADLVRYEPGVEIDSGGSRFGAGGFRIRGIGGNRTTLVIDNVPAAERFSVGNFADTGRGLLELGLINRVEVLRGPASTLYGSKALGGVVAVELLDADDLLHGNERGHRVEMAAGTDSDRLRLTGASARRDGAWTWLVAGAAQVADDRDVAGLPDGLAPDSQDRTQGAGLLRVGRDTANGRLRLTLDGIRERRETDIQAVLGSGRFANTTHLEGDDRRHQWRLLIDQHFDTGDPVSRGHWRVWHQATDTLQETDEERLLAPTPVALFRRSEFQQETTGVGANLESDLGFGGLEHRIGYGIELVRSDLTQKRMASSTELASGMVSTTVLGETFPLRDFPRTRVTELGAYVHDEIRLWSDGPVISPGLRFEYYDLSNRGDALFEARFPALEPVDLSTTAWMPRLGLLWPITDDVEVFVQVARGFRSPPFQDVNIGLDIPRFNIRAIPNPDLAPERGQTLEAGFRWRSHATRIELAVFRNRFRDFIESRAAVGFDPASGALLFQSVNRDRVRIEGVELRAQQRLTRQLDLEVAFEWLRGEDRNSGRALPEIAPPQAIVALEYAPSALWDLRLVTTATRSQRRLEDASGDPLFSPAGYAVVDLIGRWSPRNDVRLSLGLFNLADRRYWRNAGISGRGVDDPMLPLLAEPGRYALARMEWSF